MTEKDYQILNKLFDVFYVGITLIIIVLCIKEFLLWKNDKKDAKQRTSK